MKKLFLFIFLITSFAIADWNEGVQLFQAKKYKEAIPHFLQVTEAIPDGFSGWYMLGLCYLYSNDHEKALEALQKATQLNPDNGEAAHKYLTVLMKQKKYNEAYTFAKKTKEGAVPTELRGDWYKLAGFASLKAQDFNKAVEFLQKADALIDGDEVPYYLGISALQIQNYDLAIKSFQKSLTKNPKNTDAFIYKIKASIEKGRVSEVQNEKLKYYNLALQDCLKLLKEKENFENYLLAGEAALGAQKYEEALNFLEKAKNFNKNDGYVYLYIGQAQSNLEKNQEAIYNLNQAAKFLPEDKKRIAYNQLGFVYEKIKNFDEAIKAYGNANNEKKVKEVEEKKKIDEQNKKADEALKEYEKKKAEQEKKK